MAVFGAGKKGHIIAKRFLYYSRDGKGGKQILFDGMKFVKSEKGKLHVEYNNGDTKTFETSTYAYASYYAALLNAYINAMNCESEDEPLKYIVEPVVEQPQIVKQEVIDENTVDKQKEIEEQLKVIAEQKEKLLQKQAMLETQKKAEVEAKAKAEVEAKAKAEAEAKAKAETDAKLREEEREKEIDKALQMYEKKRYKEALAILREYVKNGDNLAMAYYAAILVDAGELEEALEKAKYLKENCNDEFICKPMDNLIVIINNEREYQKYLNEVMSGKARRAMMRAIRNTPVKFGKFQKIEHCKQEVVEKFIVNHKLGIKINEVLGYCDMGTLGAGKKGHIITKSFLYYSYNGNSGEKISFGGMELVSRDRTILHVKYCDGSTDIFDTRSDVLAEYYDTLLHVYIYAIRNENESVVDKALRLAEEGDAEAMYFLGVGRYANGDYICNIEESIEWCKKAAIAGSTDAMVYMGLCCMLRYGGYKGGALEGRDWFEKAAHKGSAEAWRYLAIWEYHGYGGDRSSTKYRSDFAHHMLRKAIEAGDEEARRLEIPLIKSNFVNFDVKDLLKRKGVKFDEDGFPLN